MAPTAHALGAFFSDAFEPDELRLLLFELEAGPEVVRTVRRNTSETTFSFDVADALRRHGAIDDALRKLLLSRREGRTADIEALWATRPTKATAAPPLTLTYYDPGALPLTANSAANRSATWSTLCSGSPSHERSLPPK